MGWVDKSATHGSVTWERGADSLVIGEGGAVKSDDLLRLTQYGAFEYSDVPLSNGAGEAARNPSLGPLIVVMRLYLVGDVNIADGTPNSDAVAGFKQNLAWLTDFCAPFSSGDGTFATTVVAPWRSGTYTGTSHLELMLPSPTNLYASFTDNLPLRVKVPAGALTFTED